MDEQKLKKEFLLTGHAEGISFLLLLGVAMPLKYFYDMPKAVTIMGMIHGMLFIAFIYMLYRMFSDGGWGWKKCALGFLLSIIPFGTFFLNKLK
jgi:integral membrane protein